MKTEINPKCVLCEQEITSFSHNAEPIKKGSCCGVCNDLYVIPTRYQLLLKAQGKWRSPAFIERQKR